MPNIKVDIRRKSHLRALKGATTSTDVYERQGLAMGRSRAFWDALTRAHAPVVPGIPTHMKEWGRWES